jgi:hypothetical protein
VDMRKPPFRTSLPTLCAPRLRDAIQLIAQRVIRRLLKVHAAPNRPAGGGPPLRRLNETIPMMHLQSQFTYRLGHMYQPSQDF